MSLQLISRSPDLQRLRDEGYDIEVKSGYLLVRHVPYVDTAKQVRFGTLVSELTLNNDVTIPPNTHVAYFAGEHPCHRDGAAMIQIVNSSAKQSLGDGIEVDHMFSSKPGSGSYADFYQKMTTYVAILESQAQAIDPSATARIYPVIISDQEDSVFHYVDTATSRAGIGEVTDKLKARKVGIVGLGGTGSYVLDLVAKTPVEEIHLFDGDRFLQHNAFRSPGAPSGNELGAARQKVHHFQTMYSRMRGNIVAHEGYVTPETVGRLNGMDFVFLCIDRADAKGPIICALERMGIPYVDSGMGIQLVDGALLGVLRVTTSTPEYRGHVRGKHRIPLASAVDDGEYATNIQIAELNALSASLAVIKWKKLCGFYLDLEGEHHTTYTIDGNELTNEDTCNAPLLP